MFEFLRRLAPAQGEAAALGREGDRCEEVYSDEDGQNMASRLGEDARALRSPGLGGAGEQRRSEGSMTHARQDDVTTWEGGANGKRLRPTPPQSLRGQREGGAGEALPRLREQQQQQHDSTALRHRGHSLSPGSDPASSSPGVGPGGGGRVSSPASSFNEKIPAPAPPPRLGQQLEARCVRPGLVLLCFLIGLAAGMLASDDHPLAVFMARVSDPLGSPASGHAHGGASADHGGRGGLRFMADEGHAFVADNTGSTGVPSPEEVALRALGTAELGYCEGHHGVDVATLRPVPGGIRPLMIVVTPTYVRPFQAMFLQRLANLLRRVPPPLLWIVVEIGQQTLETALLLRQTGLVYRHIVTRKEMRDIKDRGVNQRNAALEHIEEHQLNGIVFFADDDNIFSPAIFHEMRTIRRFGTWPVAMLQQGKSRAVIEGPVCDARRVIGWHTNEKSKRIRRFHVDMCGFAFNSTILWNPLAWGRLTNTSIRQLDSVKEGFQRMRRFHIDMCGFAFNCTIPWNPISWGRLTNTSIRQLDSVKEGFQETTFIEQLVPDESEMEGLANGCTDVLVWHVHSEAPRKSPFPHWTSPPKLEAVIPARRIAT